jgi:hypothetical protein
MYAATDIIGSGASSDCRCEGGLVGVNNANQPCSTCTPGNTFNQIDPFTRVRFGSHWWSVLIPTIQLHRILL